MITYITGGARSGKSFYGEELAKKAASKPTEVLYIPTAKAYDDEMQDRIRKHQERRPKEWKTLEAPESFKGLEQDPDFQKRPVIMIDCLGVFVTNRMFRKERDFDTISAEEVDEIEQEIHREVDYLIEILQGKVVFIVSNEVGMGLVPPYPLGRIFRDILGRVNQKMAAQADTVYFLVSGIPTCLKGSSK